MAKNFYSKYLAFLDLFAFMPQNKKYSSKIGLGCTLIYLFILILFSIYFFSDLIHHKKPSVSITTSNNNFNTEENSFDLKENPFFFSFFKKEFPFDIENLLEIYIYQVITINGTMKNINYKKIEKCTQEHFNIIKTDISINSFIHKENMYCLPIDYEYKIKGNYNNYEINFIKFEIKKCNKTINKNCFSNEEFLTKTKFLSLWVAILNKDINLDDYNNPTNNYWKIDQITISSDYSKLVKFNFQTNTLETDDGVIIESHKTKSFSSFDYLEQPIYYLLNNNNYSALNEPLIHGQLLYSTKKTVFKRKYKKLQDVFGQIGGSSTIIYKILWVIIIKHIEINYFLFLLKKVFEIKFEKIEYFCNKKQTQIQKSKIFIK